MTARSKGLLLVAGLLFLLSPAALLAGTSVCDAVGGNLVANCGFETGDFTNWTVGGNTGHTYVESGYAYSGTYGAGLGAVSSNGFGDADLLSQTLTTVPGQTYTLTYYLESPGGTPNGFEATWDGNPIASAGSVVQDVGPFGWTEFQFTGLLATTGSTLLQFQDYQNPSYWGFDDISVIGAVGAPEPGTFALLGCGLLSLLGIARRKVLHR
jgi:hypothetical protein